MLPVVHRVRNQILKNRAASGHISLEEITRAVGMFTSIDNLVFEGYNVPVDNPIWGQFRRYEGQRAYGNREVTVVIRYANHLSEPWRRFVVCKELCHALDDSESTNTATDKGFKGLVNAFSLMSSRSVDAKGMTRDFAAEIVAEAGAIELLCPFPSRQTLLVDGGYDPSLQAQVARDFLIPEHCAARAFDNEYIRMVAFIAGGQ